MNSSEWLSPTERAAIGKAARSAMPRTEHSVWRPAADRTSPIEVLSVQDEERVAELVPVRYGRMLATPFTFYRGGAALMAADLGSLPNSGLQVQLCGDAHLSNFGAFRAPNRALVFDINDFDETLPGPFEWDVKRLVTSFEIGARSLGFKKASRNAVALAAAASYREAMHEFAAMRDLDTWYSHLEVEEIFQRFQDRVSPRERKMTEKAVAKARNKDSLRALSRLTEEVDGKLGIADRSPLLVPLRKVGSGRDQKQLAGWMEDLLGVYRETLPDDSRHVVEQYRYVDAGRKIVGVGSVGTRCWIVLLLGRDGADPLFLQAKEAGPSVLEPFVGESEYAEHGQRVVQGQRLMQASGDILLGWLTADAPDGVRRAFYVRQLWDGKGSAVVELMGPERMEVYAQLCGWTLARAHARSGDSIAIAAYLGKSDRFDRALLGFAEAYADQNEDDYSALSGAVDSGQIPVETGV
jgi:uncharacterized protein (DUF2252 family)